MYNVYHRFTTSIGEASICSYFCFLDHFSHWYLTSTSYDASGVRALVGLHFVPIIIDKITFDKYTTHNEIEFGAHLLVFAQSKCSCHITYMPLSSSSRIYNGFFSTLYTKFITTNLFRHFYSSLTFTQTDRQTHTSIQSSIYSWLQQSVRMEVIHQTMLIMQTFTFNSNKTSESFAFLFILPELTFIHQK